MADKNSNNRTDIPVLDVAKKGRVEVSIFKMDAGFIVIDQDSNKRNAVTGMRDIKEMLEIAYIAVTDHVTNVVNDMATGSAVDITVIVESRVEDFNSPPEMEGPVELGLDQVADVINDLINARGSYESLHYPTSHGSRLMVTPTILAEALRKKNLVKIRQEPVFSTGGKRVDMPSGNKKFYNDSKNKPQQSANPNQGQNQGQPPKDPESTKLT